MLRIIDYAQRENAEGEQFFALILQDGLQLVKSQETGNYYATAKSKCKSRSKSGQPVSYKMVREYERTFYYLKDYSKKAKKKLDFKKIDLDFYYSFMEYLHLSFIHISISFVKIP